MAIQAPKTRREYGDPYATQCLLNDGYDQSACDPSGSSNPWHRSSGYYIGVELPTGSSGLDIQLYDAGFYEGSIFNDTGDYGWDLGYGARTTFRVYEPDLTPLDLSDNPLATCNLGYGPVETLELGGSGEHRTRCPPDRPTPPTVRRLAQCQHEMLRAR